MRAFCQVTLACMLCALSGCGGDDTSAAPLGQQRRDGGAALDAAPPSAAAGKPGAGSLGVTADAHVCAIPDNLIVTDQDADGGLDPGCQNVPRKVIANNCIGGICHDSNGPPAAGLDLMAPCISERLLNVESHCEGLLLLDTDDPEDSFIFDKLNHRMPRCGESMPFTGLLPADEWRCLDAWLHAVLRVAR